MKCFEELLQKIYSNVEDVGLSVMVDEETASFLSAKFYLALSVSPNISYDYDVNNKIFSSQLKAIENLSKVMNQWKF